MAEATGGELMSDIGHFEPDIYSQRHLAVITAVHFLAGQSNDVNIFSGFVAVHIVTMNLDLDWVRWSNPLMGQTKQYGVLSCPCEDDTVYVEFDPRGYAHVTAKMTFLQAIKPNGVLQDYGVLNNQSEDITDFTPEADDFRLQIQKGEVLVRGSQQQSAHFRADGSIVLKIDDTKKDADTFFLQIDANKNVTITGAAKVSVTATEVDMVAPTVDLGNGSTKAALIRSTDPVLVLDSFGGPCVWQQYEKTSQTTQSS